MAANVVAIDLHLRAEEDRLDWLENNGGLAMTATTTKRLTDDEMRKMLDVADLLRHHERFTASAMVATELAAMVEYDLPMVPVSIRSREPVDPERGKWDAELQRRQVRAACTRAPLTPRETQCLADELPRMPSYFQDSGFAQSVNNPSLDALCARYSQVAEMRRVMLDVAERLRRGETDWHAMLAGALRKVVS